MGWSTRELAELAGTSLRTVRHYHDVGLLAEPERRANGYKSYGVAHLLRVLRVKRLSDLGFSLAQIAEMGDAGEYPEQALRTLDAELAQTIERLQRIRTELALVLRAGTPTDLPPELALAAADAGLTDNARALGAVLARLVTPEARAALTEVLKDYDGHAADADFDALPAGAGEEARRDLAARMLPQARAVLTAHPELRDPGVVAPDGVRRTERVFTAALADLYNPAQLDVLKRIREALAAE